MRPPLRRAPELMEVYEGAEGVRWVVLDIGDQSQPRSMRDIKLRRVGAKDDRGSKVITLVFFLDKYKLVGVYEASMPTIAAPPGTMDKEERRAWNLHRMRLERGLTHRDVFKKTGLGPSLFTEMERGHRAISIKTIDRFAAGIKLEPAAVLAELDAAPRG